MNSSVDVDRSAINERAYLRWQQRGCPDGSPDYDWFEAEQELLREHTAVAAAPATSASTPVAVASEPAAPQQKPAPKRNRGQRGSIETSAAPASDSGAPSGRRGPASSTKPVAGSKRRAG